MSYFGKFLGWIVLPCFSAAGPWQEGEPKEAGTYLVEYEQWGRGKTKVVTYVEEKDAHPFTLLTGGFPHDVLRYAEIHSDHA